MTYAVVTLRKIRPISNSAQLAVDYRATFCQLCI